MAVATAASLWSARFANRVNNRTVGLVTGVILTAMGALLIILHYWEYISGLPLAVEILRCFGRYLLFIIPAALFLIILNYTLKIPRVLFRKLLHLAAFVSAPVVVWTADTWQGASLTLVLFAAIAYPILHFFQSWRGYDQLFVQKKPGEVKTSLLLLFLTDAALVAVCWGAFNLPYIAVAAILMWGSGDGAAALMGKRFGKHHVSLPFADPKKTWEGSGSMAAASTAVGFVTMSVMTANPWHLSLLSAAVTSIFGAYTELVTRDGNDTVTVPVVNAVILLTLQFILYR